MWYAVYTHTLNMQIPCVISECVIHLSCSNGWVELWPEPMKFLVNMLINHAPLTKNIPLTLYVTENDTIYYKFKEELTDNVIIIQWWEPIFPLKFLSLGQFYQIWQNWGDSCTKIISSGWKLATLSGKNIIFTIFHKLLWTQFSQAQSKFHDIQL